MAPSTNPRQRATKEKAAAGVKRLRSDLRFYSSHCLRIRTKDARLVPLDFNMAQRTVHEKIAAQFKDTGAVRAIVLKARQEGVSTYAAARFFRRLNLYPNQNGLVIADEKKRAFTLFGIYDLFHRHLPADLRPRKRYITKSEFLFDAPDGTGLNSRIAVETARDAQAGRAATIQMLHASEFAFWDHAEDVWSGLMQAIPDANSEVIIESTANGVGNLFHEIWTQAEDGESGFVPIFLPWWIHEEYASMLLSVDATQEVMETQDDWETEAMTEGLFWEGRRHILSPGQIAWRRKTIRDKLSGSVEMFRQEYPSDAREAFLVSGNCFFDEEVLSSYEKTCRPPEIRANLTWVGPGIAYSPASRGWLRMWERPRADGRYVIFADTATGKAASRILRASEADSERGGRDFSCADVMEVRSRSLVASLHGHIPPEVFAEQIRMLGYLYSGPKPHSSVREPAFIGVERNHSSGETVLRYLKEHWAYPHLFYNRRMNQRYNRVTEKLGWTTSAETKMPMLDELSAAFREGTIDVRDKDTIRECFTFIRNLDGNPGAQEGTHDDRVIALAGCLQMLRHDRPANMHALPPLPRDQLSGAMSTT